MAAPQNFRSAFNGFHREDVVRYLEYINAKHQDQVNQLTAETNELRDRLERFLSTPFEDPEIERQLEELTQERDQLRMELEQIQQEREQLRIELEQTQQEREQLRLELEQPQQFEAPCPSDESGESPAAQELESLRAQLDAALLEKESLRSQLETLPQSQVKAQPVLSSDLEAYRRADKVERMARERSELIYHQANGVLTEATARVESAAQSLTRQADDAMAQLTQLQIAVSAGKQALQDAASIMSAIRPNP